MSASPQQGTTRPTTIADLQRMKRDGERIVMITAYDYPSARIADRAGLPLLLVGDSVGMVVHGHSTTLPVTLDDMVRHASAVMRASESALVVCDLPFLTYASEADAVASARRVMAETGVQAVKLEGGASRRLRVPTIGIGAGVGCDGQVQVWHDVLGLYEGKSPRHAKRYGEIGKAIEQALRAYVEDVASGAFPTRAHSAGMDEAELASALREPN